MATTETRTGFRLPWVSEAHATADAAAEDETDGTGATGGPDAAVDAGAPTAGQEATEPGPPDLEASLAASQQPSTAQVAPAAAPRRPSKFLADLARAMRAAAETERDEILDRFRSEAKTFVETMHERSAVEAAELRATADGDIGGIREWSKAEIARIREETEHRIAERRSLLDQEIEAHAALIELRIEHINASVETFEAEMSRFFEELLVEEDPAYFAEMAGDLPEPPSLEAIASEDLEALQAQAETFAESPAEAEAAVAQPAVTETTEDQAPHEAAGALAVGAEAEDGLPAESPQPDEAAGDDAAGDDAAAAAGAGAATADAGETDEAGSGAAAEAPARTGDGTHAQPVFDEDALTLDPRVAALGLTPDFGAAEAEAAAALATDLPDDGSSEEIPAFDEATIASRLAGLVPTAPATSDLVETRVIVSGLVSVASIAGFKRGLGRLPGVQSVSVSSGPDGEFVFAAVCAAGVDLAGAIATMQGFSARVTSASDGRLEVVAHDPDAA